MRKSVRYYWWGRGNDGARKGVVTEYYGRKRSTHFTS